MVRGVVKQRGGGRGSRRRGFTLVELIVAGVIIAGVSAAVATSLSMALRAQRMSQTRQEALLRADAAAMRIAQDVKNIVRDGDLFFARLAIADRSVDGQERDEMLMFSRSVETVRPIGDRAEGGEFEVQYRVVDAAGRRGRAGAVLYRRVDPVPDRVPDGGGVVFPIVEGIRSLSIEAFDGSSWQPSWESDVGGYPYAVRITVSAVSDDGSVVEHARRTVAIHRPPLPYVPVLDAFADGGLR